MKERLLRWIDLITSNNDNDAAALKNSNEPSSFEHSVSSVTADENEKGKAYVSRAEIRKNERKMRNGVGRNHSVGVRVEKSKGFLPDSFDRVLLDAPCSALGLRPRLFSGEETVESLRKHGIYQRRLFDQAVQLVRPGGVIVYSTCTINPGENEAVVRYALDMYKFLSLAPQRPKVEVSVRWLYVQIQVILAPAHPAFQMLQIQFQIQAADKS